MLKLSKLKLVLVTFVLTYAASLQAVEKIVDAELTGEQQSILLPEAQHPNANKLIMSIIMREHYVKPVIDDHFSSDVFDAYIKYLDANRIYFYQSDIDVFEKYRHALDEALLKSDLNPAYEIFAVFQKRWRERYNHALTLVDAGFDFDKKEMYQFDREELPWAKNEVELNEIWRKRVKLDALNLKLADKEIADIKELLQKRFKSSLRRNNQMKNEDVFWFYMNAFTSTIDPHTSYLSPRVAENFDIEMKLSLEGIGAVLRSDDVYTQIVELVPNGPADKTKQLNPKDRIVAVGQDELPLVDVVGWRLDDVVKIIRGKAGSKVRLEILPEKGGASATSKVVPIVRERVELKDQQAQSSVIELDRDGKKTTLGVITIPKFYIDFQAKRAGDKNYRSTTRDVAKLITELKKQHQLSGIIIDLRDNGGGSLMESIELTGLFIDKGPVVMQKQAYGRVFTLKDRNAGVFYDGPLAVLVNGFSASASEIFSAAIQDYGRGLIVGEQTFGKGTVQSIESMSRFFDKENAKYGDLKYTIASFYRITGESTQHKGVIPDIEFPTLFDVAQYGEGASPNALPWDKIEQAKFKRLLNNKPLLNELKEKHLQRRSNDPEFSYLLQDIERYNKRKEQKTFSLNLAERKQELDEQSEIRLSRINARRKQKGLDAIKDLDDVIDEDDIPDFKLNEAANILYDYSNVLTDARLMAASKIKK